MQDLQSTQLAKFEKIVIENLGNGQVQSALKFSNTRFNGLSGYIHGVIEKTQSYFDEEGKTLDAVTGNLNGILGQLKERKEANRFMLNQLREETQRAESDLNTLNKYEPPQREIDLKSKIQQYKHDIIKLNQEREAQAKALDCIALSTINMKNKDQDNIVNELFKWLLFFLYKDQTSNYYWPNFKQEAFGNDKGEDFRQRCAKIRAVDIKRDEAVKTTLILSIKDKIVSDPLLNPAQRNGVNQLFSIVQSINDINNLSIEVHSTQKILDKQAQETARVQQEVERANDRLKVLKERAAFQDQIYHIYDQLLQQIERKLHSYHQAVQNNTQYIQQLENGYRSLDMSKHNNQTYVPPPQQQEQVEETPQQIPSVPQVQEAPPQQFEEEDQQQQVNTVPDKPVEVKYEYNPEQDNQKKTPQQPINRVIQSQPPTEIAVERKEGGCNACTIF